MEEKGWKHGEEEKRVTSVAEQYPCCLVPLNPSSGTGAKALCQDVTTRDSTTQPPMGHHYPDLAAHSGYDSISRTRFPGYTPTPLSSLALFARKREKERVVGPANWHVWVHHLLSFFPRPRDYVTRRRAILVYLLSIVSLNKNPPYPGFESVSVRLVSSYDYRDVVDTREVFHLNGIKISEESLDSNLSRIMQVCFTSSIRTKQDITIFKHFWIIFSIFHSSRPVCDCV